MKESFHSWTLRALPTATTLHTPLCIENPHRDRYLDWNSNHPISAKRSVIQALTHRAKMVGSTSRASRKGDGLP